MKTKENIQFAGVLGILAVLTFCTGFYNPFHFASGAILALLSWVTYKHW